MKLERCFHCDEPTGRAGRADDSIYDVLDRGPYCPACWSLVEPLNDALDGQDICGFCGRAGADKIPHPVRWPGEMSAETEFVHAACEDAECARAHAALSDQQRREFLSRL